MIASPARYSLCAALVLGPLALLAGQGARLGLLPVLGVLLLLAWPAWVGLAYPAALRKIDLRSSLREGERPWWAPFLGGALWRQVLAVPVALLAAWSAAWTLIAEGWTGLLWIAAAGALLYPAARLVVPQARALRPYARLRPVLVVAPLLVAAGLTAARLLVAGLGALGEGTLAEHVAAGPRYEGPSALLAWAVDGTALASGFRAWAEGRLGPLGMLWRLVGAFGQFWLLAGLFAGGLLPPGEARRILRASEADAAPPVGRGRAALAGFVAAILALALTSLLAQAEAWAMARHRPEALAEMGGLVAPDPGGGLPDLGPGRDGRPTTVRPGLPTPADLRLAVEAERLGDLTCPKGTIAEVERLDAELRATLDEQRAAIESAARQGFDAMRANVPAYLDWHYSLTAEYARTGHLLIGDAGAYLEERFRHVLGQGDPLAPLATAMEALSRNPARLEGWRQRRAQLLGPCEDLLVPLDGLAVDYTAHAPADLLEPGLEVEAIAFETRLAGAGLGGTAGAVAGALLGKTVGKIAASAAVEALAKVLAKAATAKALGGIGGAAGGASVGGAIGSVVPGVGTVIGAAVGGAVGALTVSVGVDAALVEFEELYTRDAFEAEILAAIDAAEAEVLAGLSP